jgi:AcrR family transcriptional regulator
VRPYHHGDLAASLLDAVCEIVREVGPGHVSLREAARRAGVSHAAPAHHFGNKRGLLTAFAAEGFERLSHAIRDELTTRPPASGPSHLAALGRAYVRFAVAHPEHFSVMFRQDLVDPADPLFTAGSDAAWGALHGAVARCIDEGVVAPQDATIVATAAWSLVHGLADLCNGGRLQPRLDRDLAIDLERLTDAVTERFVAGLSRPAAPVQPGSRGQRVKAPARSAASAKRPRARAKGS